jgi:hypothetical protein
MIAAGALYFAALFALGFLLGAPRTLFLEPLLGAAAAVAIESLPMLGAMYAAAPWAARVGGVPGAALAHLGMGLFALLLLVVTETAMDVLLRGRVLWADRAQSVAGWIGFALMAAFVVMPLLRRGT